MIYEEILQFPDINSRLKDFLEGDKHFEILIKKLDLNEIKRFNIEYPNFLKIEKKNMEKLTNLNELKLSIFCLTLVKNDNTIKNYTKLKKLKIYIDESKKRAVKILQK